VPGLPRLLPGAFIGMARIGGLQGVGVLRSPRLIGVACALALAVVALAGCNEDGSTAAQPAAAASSATLASTALSIEGAPPTVASVGQPYRFTPQVSGAQVDTLSFGIENLPAWASFDSATGTLSGTPNPEDAGTFSNIAISVRADGSSAALLPFSITVNQAGASSGTAEVSWEPPTTNTDGTVLTDLAGYRIYFGTNQNALTQTVDIANVGVTTYLVADLAPGTWYFAVTAYTTTGVESGLSSIASKTIG